MISSPNTFPLVSVPTKRACYSVFPICSPKAQNIFSQKVQHRYHHNLPMPECVVDDTLFFDHDATVALLSRHQSPIVAV